MDYSVFLKNQPNVVRLFNNTINKNRLVHTYLFEGAKGTKKLDGAYYLASMILCSGDTLPCLECSECLKVSNKTHPNVFYIEPVGDVIKKEQITNLEHEFSMTALSGSKRVFIINGIDKCNTQSANSLLKFLEEANENCYGILITENLNAVIPTIVSRSQVVHFKKVSKEIIESSLVNDGVDLKISKILSNITNDVDEAKSIISEGLLLDVIDGVKLIGKSIICGENSYLVYIDTLRDLLKDKKEYNLVFLNILGLFLNDCIHKSIYDETNIIFTNEVNEISEYISSDYNDNVKMLEIILKYKERLRYNINIELMYCQMFIELGGLNG